MTAHEAARILLVRSLEESDANAFAPSVLDDALQEAGHGIGQDSWFVRRADALLRRAPQWQPLVLPLSRFPDTALPWVLLGALLAGLATNYLGPPGKIHVLYNPIMALVAWNVLVLALGLALILTRPVRRLLPGAAPDRRAEAARPLEPTRTNQAGDHVPPAPTPASVRPHASGRGMDDGAGRPPWVLRVLLRHVWESLLVGVVRYRQRADDALVPSRVLGRFWTHWSSCAGRLLLSRWRRLLHLGAAALALGAIAGMYLRGLVLDYNVIWTSTFVKGEAAVARLVDLFFAPARLLSRLAGLGIETQTDLPRLVSPAGDPAAAWIHLFAISAIVLVILPRAGLALRSGVQAGRLARRMRVDPDEYFRKIVRPQMQQRIRDAVERAVAEFSDDMAAFVRDALYDRRIVPELQRFRESGGSLSGLKDRIRRLCEEFQPELDSHRDGAIGAFERALGSRLRQMAGGVAADVGAAGLAGETALSPDRAAAREIERSVGFIGHGVTDAVGLTVSASVAVALGTISGGFGEALGVAILTALLGTTGPIGFLLGAILGLVVAGAGWWLGREKITRAMEGLELPAAVLRAVLWTARYDGLIEEGRGKCQESVRRHIAELMGPLIPTMAEEIGARLERLGKR